MLEIKNFIIGEPSLSVSSKLGFSLLMANVKNGTYEAVFPKEGGQEIRIIEGTLVAIPIFNPTKPQGDDWTTLHCKDHGHGYIREKE